MVDVRTAPTKARKLAKSCGYLRRTLSETSKAEQAGTAGAKEARERITANLQKDIDATRAAVATTEAAAGDVERIAIGRHPKARALQLLSLPEPRLRGIADLAKHIASRLRDSADKAQDRLDAADDDLQATALHALIVSRLPDLDFNIKHPALSDLRRKYQAHVEAAKKARQ